MRKKILITIFAYVLMVFLLSLTKTPVKDLLITSIVNSLPFIGYIAYVIWKEKKDAQRGQNQDELKKISQETSLFGLGKNLVSNYEFYFDHNNFYAVNEFQQKISYPLTEIFELSRTGTIIGNRPVWQVKIFQKSESETVYKFTHNWTLWNSNFTDFHARLTDVNPAAVKSKWTFLRS